MMVNRTISLPFTVMETIIEEAEIMNKSFSEATAILVRIGVSQRQFERQREIDEIKNSKK